jgi:8-hydroxy-5-deazaflavin:NADPH oxidoreductase
VRIGILGSGVVGQTIGAALVERDEDVVLGTRSPTEVGNKRGFGTSLADWLKKTHDKARIGTFEEAARHGELVINATSGDGALKALELAGAGNLANKILIDISNPLDFSHGLPPSLSVCNTDSLGEQIQRTFPDSKVVKTLNTTNAFVMVNPAQVGGGDHDLFVSGNDGAAKARVIELLRHWFGWQTVIDLGDITTARGTEMLLPIWIRLWSALGTPMFNFKIVR